VILAKFISSSEGKHYLMLKKVPQMQPEVRSDHKEAVTTPIVFEHVMRQQSALKRVECRGTDLRSVHASWMIVSKLTLETIDSFLDQVSQPGTEDPRRFLPYPRFKINIHETSVRKDSRTLYDTGTKLDAPRVLLKNPVVWYQRESSRLRLQIYDLHNTPPCLTPLICVSIFQTLKSQKQSKAQAKP
jgi:hypothetical protein